MEAPINPIHVKYLNPYPNAETKAYVERILEGKIFDTKIRFINAIEAQIAKVKTANTPFVNNPLENGVDLMLTEAQQKQQQKELNEYVDAYSAFELWLDDLKEKVYTEPEPPTALEELPVLKWNGSKRELAYTFWRLKSTYTKDGKKLLECSGENLAEVLNYLFYRGNETQTLKNYFNNPKDAFPKTGTQVIDEIIDKRKD